MTPAAYGMFDVEAWPAPAKLNLLLRIIGRRPDGYHLLQTVFQFLDFGDELRFRIREDGVIRCLHTLDGVREADDLTYRAAVALQRHTGCPLGADILLEKRIPVGGGLGGGSSDAATTLVALNYLWGTELDRTELASIGLALGADVPVFIHGRSSWAEGVGERVTPLNLPEPWYLVVVPPCQVATKDVFNDPQLTRDSVPITIADFLSGCVVNDCTPVVRRRYSEVAAALDWLAQHGQARLTGTGACVFAEFASREDAQAVSDAVPPQFKAFVARGCGTSRLLDHAKRCSWGVAKR